MANPQKQKFSFRPNPLVRKLRRSVWFFPVILLLPLIILTSLRISGSSVGAYHQIIYGPQSHDPNLLFGHPQSIRSDEWLSSTQLTIAQSKDGFPQFNKDVVGSGRDTSLVGDAPNKNWSTAFKPQNLSFLVLPLENAFAFKWWFLLYTLIVSCYFFTLRIFKGKRLFSAIFSTAIGLSPFLFWWYQSPPLLSLAYGFLICVLVMRIFDNQPALFLKNKKQIYSQIIYGLALAYLLVAFALIFYPPFQVPVAIGTAAIVIGHLLNKKLNDGLSWRFILKRTAVLAVGIILATGILGVFLTSHHGVVSELTHTAYPGGRVATSGHTNHLIAFDGFIQPQLQSVRSGTHFYGNQSEVSNFILLAPFLVLPCLLATAYEWRKYRHIDWLFVLVQLCVLMFLARMYLPYGNSFYRLLQLDLVPNPRLIIGLGFIGVAQMLLLLRKLEKLKIPTKLLFSSALVYTSICLSGVLYIGFHTISHVYPLFISYPPKIILLALGFCSIIFAVLIKRPLLAASLLLIFSFASVVDIHPLYRGLGWIENNQLFAHMQADSPTNARWASADVIVFENFGLLAQRHNLSGVQLYPDINFWKQIPGKQNKDIYNRYAHILFDSNPTYPGSLNLVQPDFFEVRLSCNRFVMQNVDYVLDTNNLSLPCLQLKDTVTYPAASFHIYRVLTP